MHKATKSLMKELIEYYEGCGRDRRKTTSYFVRTKKESNQKISKLLTKYIRQGSSLLEVKGKRKGRRYLQLIALETSKKILKLLQQDPTLTTAEGAQIVGISRASFSKHKDRLMTPGKLTTEMKIQLGIIPPQPSKVFEDEKQIETKSLPPTSNAKLELGVNPEDCNANDYFDDMDSAEDYLQFENTSNDNDKFQNEENFKTEPYSPHSRSGRPPRKTFNHCLLCYVRHNSKMELKKKLTQFNRPQISTPLPSILNDDSELGENLNVIFALKNIFGLESSDLNKFMKASKGRDPRGWYYLCNECDGVMKEAVAIQFQVRRLSRQLEKCKGKIQEKVKESCRKGLGKLKTEDLDVNDDLLVTKLIRECLCPHKKKKTKVGKSVSREVELKTEALDEDDFEPAVNFGNPESLWNSDADEVVTDPPTVEVVAPSTVGDVNVNSSSSTEAETELSSIIGINQSGDSIRDLKMKPKLVICDLRGAEVRIFSLPLHTLRVHDIVMDGYTELKCSETGCQYKTVYKMNLDDHMKGVHVQGRNFSCQFCGKKFKCNAHLRNHENLHKNAETRPYQCEICGRSFASKAALRNHVRGVHEGYVSPFRRRLMAQNRKKKTGIFTDPGGAGAPSHQIREQTTPTPQVNTYDYESNIKVNWDAASNIKFFGSE